MNIFLHELKANRKALIIWSVVVVFLIAAGMTKFSAYTAGGANNAIFDTIPPSIKAMLGMGSFDVTTIAGYFAMLFLYIELAAAIHAMLLGTGIVSKEERDKTAEFLFTLPTSRRAVINAKILAALVNIFILNLVLLVSSIVLVAPYTTGDSITGEISVFMLSLFLVQLIFLSLGTALAAFVKNPKGAGSLGLAVLLISFVLSKITDLAENLTFLNLLAPFKYFDYGDIVNHNGINPIIALASLVMVGIFTYATFALYQKRDLHL